jgi:hypothetical protein
MPGHWLSWAKSIQKGQPLPLPAKNTDLWEYGPVWPGLLIFKRNQKSRPVCAYLALNLEDEFKFFSNIVQVNHVCWIKHCCGFDVASSHQLTNCSAPSWSHLPKRVMSSCRPHVQTCRKGQGQFTRTEDRGKPAVGGMAKEMAPVPLELWGGDIEIGKDALVLIL